MPIQRKNKNKTVMTSLTGSNFVLLPMRLGNGSAECAKKQPQTCSRQSAAANLYDEPLHAKVHSGRVATLPATTAETTPPIAAAAAATTAIATSSNNNRFVIRSPATACGCCALRFPPTCLCLVSHQRLCCQLAAQ